MGEMAGEITITIPDSVLQSTTPNRLERLLPPDAVEISFQYRDPAKAQAVANDLGNIMIDEYGKELERHNAETIKLLSSEVDETRGKLAESQRQIKILKEKYRGSMPQDLDDNVKALQVLQLQLERSAESASKTDASGAALPESPKPTRPKQRLQRCKNKAGCAQRPVQRRVSGGDRDQVADRRPGEGSRKTRRSNRPLRRAPDSATGLIQQQIDDYQRGIAETPAHEEAIAAVNRDYAILSSRYHDLNNLFFEARADQAVLERGQGERLKVLQPAVAAHQSVIPKSACAVGGGVAMTLIIALAIPFGLFYTDTSFKDSDDVRAEFADVNAIVISRVPEVEHRHRQWRAKIGGGSARTAGKWSRGRLRSAIRKWTVRQRRSSYGRWRISKPQWR